MDAPKVELVDHRILFQSFFRMDEYRLRHALHAGGMSEELTREIFERGQVAAVLPVDPDTDTIVLIEQFRLGAYVVGWHPWLLEVVAGVIEEGETAEELARREAMEEADCRITALEHMHTYLASPGGCTESVTLFAGRIDARNAGGVHGLAEEQEDIRVIPYPVREALALIGEGRIVNATTLVALQWLALNYEDLKRRWLTA